MPTRQRVRVKAPVAPKPEEENQQLDFDPTAVAGISTGGERVGPEDTDTGADDGQEFYDSQQAGYQDDADDGSEDDTGTVVEQPEEKDADPSAATQLGKTKAGMTQGQQAAQAELKDYLRRMANLTEERDNINEDIKELKKEIKGKGYDMKAFALIDKLLNMDEGDRKARLEQKGINETYAEAVGIDIDLV
jgi:uncharacterized protein (UPF0335 family)